MKEVRFFLGHARLLQDNITLLQLALKEYNFWLQWNQIAFRKLKEVLTLALVIQPSNWDLPFEIMCDTSDYAVRVMLGQYIDKLPHIIYYASRTLNDAQLNYSTTEK